MSYIYLVITLGIAIIDWLAVVKKWQRTEYVTKPAVMIALIAWLLSEGGFQGHLLWFTLGVIFSMAGDVFLMLPRDLFIPGLVSFLLAHLCYIVGINKTLPGFSLPGVILLVIVAVTAVQIYRRVADSLKAKGLAKLRMPVLAYTCVISVMLLSALLTLVGTDWVTSAALAVSVGALLFFLSDAVLAWNKFVAPLPNGRIINITTYHLGQVGIVMGALLHFVK